MHTQREQQHSIIMHKQREKLNKTLMHKQAEERKNKCSNLRKKNVPNHAYL